MKEKGIILGLFPKNVKVNHIERRITEIEDLSRTLSIDIQEIIVQKISDINPATYMGFGKVEELKRISEKLQVE